MQTEIFQELKGKWTSANLIHNRLNCKWLISPAFTASLELRNRFLSGSMLKDFPGYNKAFETDNGLLDLSENIFDKKSFLLNSSIDRAWIQYTSDRIQFTAGRQRINWGQTFVWNPNDIFNSYSYFDFDYEEKPGSDAVRMQYYAGPSSVFEIAAKYDKQRKATIAGLYRFNKWKYDIQFLGGIAEQNDFVIGTGWSGQLFDGGFRGEVTFFYPEKNFNDTTGIIIASAGYDYTFKNSMFLQLEALYNGNKNSSNILSPGQFSMSNVNPKNLFLSDCSFFGALSYPVTPLINASLSAITNPKNKMFFAIPSLSLSLKENLELSFTAQLMRYYENNSDMQDLNFIYARLKYSF